MYCILVGCFAVLSVCVARPAQVATASLVSHPSTGFPIDYLPATAVLQNSSGALELPTNPNHERDLTVRSSWTGLRTSLPKRPELVMSLAIEIYWYWRMDHNTGVTRSSRSRGEAPFENFWYSITPVTRLGTSLTTLKLGIAYCWVLVYAINEDVTSRDLVAQINENPHGMIGSILVTTSPRQDSSTAPSMLQSSLKVLERSFWANETLNSLLMPGSPKATLQMLPEEMERRWFGCLDVLLMYIIQHPTSDVVANDLPPVPSTPSSNPLSSTYRFWRVPRDRSIQDYIDVTVYVPAATRFMTWKVLAEELLIMGSGVALGYPYSTTGFVRDGTTVLAMLKITVDGGALGGDVTNATATA
ncbi:hypothetical protein XPA_008880 [Xanthoria parietina]